MLREVEECVKTLLIENKNEPEGEEHREVVNDWESRLQITQVTLLIIHFYLCDFIVVCLLQRFTPLPFDF